MYFSIVIKIVPIWNPATVIQQKIDAFVSVVPILVFTPHYNPLLQQFFHGQLNLILLSPAELTFCYILIILQ
jgi:hypothetical protein